MDFLDKIILDNPIRSYLVVFGLIALMIILKKTISRYIASLLFSLVHRNWKNIEKAEFIALIIKPLSWFLTISIAVFAIDKLNFPQAFYFKIYGHSSDEIISKIGICLIIIYFFWFLLSFVNFIALIFEQKAKQTKDPRDDQLIVFFRDFFKVVIIIACILLLIKVGFNQNIGTVLTGLSIVGAAMALAAKESLENLIASFVIFFDKPFFTGDTLKVNNVTGTVEYIGLRSTRIRTTDKTLVTVPNKQMVDSIVDNLSMRNQRRAEIKMEFDAKTSTSNLKSFVDKVKHYLQQQLEIVVKHSVFVTDFNKNGITVTIELFTIHCTMAEFNSIRENLNFYLKQLIEELKLELASGGNDINIFNGDPTAAVNPKSQPII